MLDVDRSVRGCVVDSENPCCLWCLRCLCFFATCHTYPDNSEKKAILKGIPASIHSAWQIQSESSSTPSTRPAEVSIVTENSNAIIHPDNWAVVNAMTTPTSTKNRNTEKW